MCPLLMRHAAILEHILQSIAERIEERFHWRARCVSLCSTSGICIADGHAPAHIFICLDSFAVGALAPHFNLLQFNDIRCSPLVFLCGKFRS